MGSGVCLWLTGLSGSGKTTLSVALAQELGRHSLKVERLDGDEIRKTLCKDLSFSKEDRFRNIERVVYVANLLTRNDIITIVSLISPYREMRERARHQIPTFVELFVDCPLDVCALRDVKGHYQRAAIGMLENFTGINDVYEIPTNPDLILKTAELPVDACVKQVLRLLQHRGFCTLFRDDIK